MTDAAGELLPEEWYVAFEAASATAFYYAVERNSAFLQHKFIYPNEAEAVDAVVEFLRPMLSKGSAEKLVTNKSDEGQHAFQQLKVEGPITGAIPTTRNKLNDELQTRLLITELSDYEGRVEAHTRVVSRLRSPNWTGNVDTELLPRWRAALRSLTGVRKVVTDLGDNEKFGLSTSKISHGARLWGNLLSLMDAHAWLEQRNREIRTLPDGEQAVVATAEDYEAAYRLFKATSTRSAVNIGDTHRKILDAVWDLKEEESDRESQVPLLPSGSWGVRQIAEKAGISPGTVTKNRSFLTKSLGFLYEEEDSKRLALDPNIGPEDWKGNVLEGFPMPHEVKGWGLAGNGPGDGGSDGMPPSPDPGNTGNMETVDQDLHTYAGKDVSTSGNNKETVETVFPEGPELTEEESRMLDILKDNADLDDMEEWSALVYGNLNDTEEVSRVCVLLGRLNHKGAAEMVNGRWVAK